MAKQTQDIANAVTQVANPQRYRLFDTAQVQGFSGIRAHYVGQGDAISILDQDGSPCLYFDYGGLGDHPDRANQYKDTAKRLPLTVNGNDIGIVLSHWDKDHYYSAKKVRKAEDVPWLVPRQVVGVHASRFSAKLTNARRWPDNMAGKPVSYTVSSGDEIRVEQIGDISKTSDRNLTGLAVSVVKKADDGTEPKYIILPGDAPFHRIGHIANGRSQLCLVGSMAYHHGSKTHWTTATAQSFWNGPRDTNVKVVFSYGPNNNYGHPQKQNYTVLGNSLVPEDLFQNWAVPPSKWSADITFS